MIIIFLCPIGILASQATTCIGASQVFLKTFTIILVAHGLLAVATSLLLDGVTSLDASLGCSAVLGRRALGLRNLMCFFDSTTTSSCAEVLRQPWQEQGGTRNRIFLQQSSHSKASNIESWYIFAAFAILLRHSLLFLAGVSMLEFLSISSFF